MQLNERHGGDEENTAW